MAEQPALRLVDEHGELHSTCPHCQALEDQLDGAQREIRSWRAAYANLKRDKEKEAKEHPAWPVAVGLFKQWKETCGHPNSRWTVDRFWLIEPLLEKYGEGTCQRAIAGAGFDPHIYRRKNGSVKRCDEWKRIFESADRLEDFANKAPRGWKPPESPTPET